MAVDTSIIITNYNNEKYLGRCIRSCLKQSLEPKRYEIVVIDDCSKDNSKEIIESYGDKIVPIFLKENKGVAEASNVGIRQALGSFIIRVDSDDYINEHTLLVMTEIMIANPDIGFIYPDHILVDAQENRVGDIPLNTIDKVKRHGAGIMFRKSNMEALGLYDKRFRNAEDHDLITRYLKNFDSYHLRLPLYRYRWHGENMTTDNSERIKWEQKANEKNIYNSGDRTQS